MILFFDIICGEIGDSRIRDEFFNRFRVKLQTPFNLLSSPFNKKELYHERELYCFLLDIAWVKFFWLGLVLLFTCFMLKLSLVWWLLPGLMTLMYVFWCPWFYLFLFMKGLKKAGFKGWIKKLSAEEFMGRLIEWDK